MIDFERDISLVKDDPEGKALESLHYRTLLGMGRDLNPQTSPALLKDTGEAESSDSEGENSDEDSSKFINSSRPRDESPNSKKVGFFLFDLYTKCLKNIYDKGRSYVNHTYFRC